MNTGDSVLCVNYDNVPTKTFICEIYHFKGEATEYSLLCDFNSGRDVITGRYEHEFVPARTVLIETNIFY